MGAGDIFLGLLAIIFPPLAVWIKSGICSCDSLINILLLLLGYIPGLIHAWYIIATHPEHDYDYEPIDDAERGQVTAFFVVDGRGAHQGQNVRGGSGYGTTNGQAQGPPPPNVPNDSRPQAQFPGEGNGEGSAARPPPTYAEAVSGDHKIQTQD